MSTTDHRLVNRPLFRTASAGEQGPGFTDQTAPSDGVVFVAKPAAPACHCEAIMPALLRVEAAIAALLIDVADLRRRVEARE